MYSKVIAYFRMKVKKLVDEDVIATAKSLVISSTATDLDSKFEDAVSLLPLDFEDKATLTTSWEGAPSSSFYFIFYTQRPTDAQA